MANGNTKCSEIYTDLLLKGKSVQTEYCKTGNFHVRLIFANFVIVIKMRKLIFVNIFAYHYNI